MRFVLYRLLLDSRMTAPTALVVAIVSLPLVLGCGPKSDRLALSGKITFNGAPLDEGEIHFASVGAEKASASGVHIANGEYRIPQDKGLRPGTYRVEISAPDKSKPAASYGAPGQARGPATAAERIPPEYNDKSNKTIEVKADGDNHFDFDITVRGSK